MESTFIETNDRIVNLGNVSNIHILPGENRIIFNMNYGINMGNKLVSDYVYWDCINPENFQFCVEQLRNHKSVYDFIESPDGLVFINIKEISSVKFSDKKLRVIFNLSHSVDFISPYDHTKKLTSEFVYVNLETPSIYSGFKKSVKQILK